MKYGRPQPYYSHNAYQSYKYEPSYYSHHPSYVRLPGPGKPQYDHGELLNQHEHRLNMIEQRLQDMETQAQLHKYDDVDIYHNAYSFHGHRY